MGRLALFATSLLLFSPAVARADLVGGGSGTARTLPADDAVPATYCASTNGTVATGTTVGTVTSVLYLFHPATEPKRYKLRYGEIHGSQASGTGRMLLRITSITAENGTPGGTLSAALPLVGTNAASNAIVRVGAAAPTRAAADYYVISKSAAVELDFVFNAIPGFQPITMLGGVASGMELRIEITAALSAAANVAAWACWTED